MRIAPRSLTRIKEKIREHTKRNNPLTLRVRITKLGGVIRGWVNYFCLAEAGERMTGLDEMTRSRLRTTLWKQWKTVSCRIRNLIRLGVTKAKAYQLANTRKAYCRIARPTLLTTLNKSYFAGQGFVGFQNYYYWKTKHQTKLF
ncbi:group II intron maturase-specific domain-containing protein [Arcticibacter sp. MXS-1]|uniref:group II intron maturase-specific domain-containing protein n=1 Tax=Arcticibacter sp. MXS-1 TaxID=3341726 RepID=UPI0035A977B4